MRTIFKNNSIVCLLIISVLISTINSRLRLLQQDENNSSKPAQQQENGNIQDIPVPEHKQGNNEVMPPPQEEQGNTEYMPLPQEEQGNNHNNTHAPQEEGNTNHISQPQEEGKNNNNSASKTKRRRFKATKYQKKRWNKAINFSKKRFGKEWGPVYTQHENMNGYEAGKNSKKSVNPFLMGTIQRGMNTNNDITDSQNQSNYWRPIVHRNNKRYATYEIDRNNDASEEYGIKKDGFTASPYSGNQAIEDEIKMRQKYKKGNVDDISESQEQGKINNDSDIYYMRRLNTTGNNSEQKPFSRYNLKYNSSQRRRLNTTQNNSLQNWIPGIDRPSGAYRLKGGIDSNSDASGLYRGGLINNTGSQSASGYYTGQIIPQNEQKKYKYESQGFQGDQEYGIKQQTNVSGSKSHSKKSDLKKLQELLREMSEDNVINIANEYYNDIDDETMVRGLARRQRTKYDDIEDYN